MTISGLLLCKNTKKQLFGQILFDILVIIIILGTNTDNFAIFSVLLHQIFRYVMQGEYPQHIDGDALYDGSRSMIVVRLVGTAGHLFQMAAIVVAAGGPIAMLGCHIVLDSSTTMIAEEETDRFDSHNRYEFYSFCNFFRQIYE